MDEPQRASLPSGAPPRDRRGLKIVIMIAIVAVIALGAWLLWGRSGAATSADGSSARTGKAGASKGSGKGAAKGGGRFAVDPNRAQPVAAAAATRADVNIVQTALGTAT